MKEEIAFPYSISTLGFVLKKLGFRFKRRHRESIVHKRSDLIAWRESFLRRIKEIREKETERQIVYMKGKPTASGEQVIINNVFKYFKANNPSDRDHSLFKHTAEATGSSLSTVRRIVQQKNGLKTPGKKRPNRKEEFSKLDEFDLGVIRRIVRGYNARNETFSLKNYKNN